MRPQVLAPDVAAFTAFARATSKATRKATPLLFPVAVLLAGAAAVRGQSALDGFNPNADGARRFAKLSTDLARASEPRQLCLTDRVAYQRAIEEVYWRLHESALWPTLRSGSYTTILSGVGGTSGVGLIEFYEY